MKNKLPWIIISFLIAFIVVGGILFKKKLFPQTKSTTYSAVFLTNGQVYFGKLVEKRSYYDLTKAYYIEAQQNSNTQPVLVPITSALHLPTDEMKILKNQVFFTEELSTTSPITQSIK